MRAKPVDAYAGTEHLWSMPALRQAVEELQFCAHTFESMGGSGPAHATRIRAALAALRAETKGGAHPAAVLSLLDRLARAEAAMARADDDLDSAEKAWLHEGERKGSRLLFNRVTHAHERISAALSRLRGETTGGTA